MDSITQGLLGAVAAQLGFRQKIGRDATWAAAIAAMLPDLDILIAPAMELAGLQTSQLTGLKIHRGLTHSVLMIPLYCLPLAGLWLLLRRRWRRPAPPVGADEPALRGTPCCGSLGWLYACLLAAVMTHPLLDVCTSYGTQLLAPFSSGRYAIDAVAIIDIIYTPLLVLTLLACWIARRVSKNAVHRLTFAMGLGGMLLSSGYLTAGRHLHHVAIDRGIASARAQGAIAPGEPITRADAFPAMGTIFLWRTVLETPQSWVAVRVHHWADPAQPRALSVAARQSSPWIEKARQLPDAQTFDWFTGGRTRAAVSRQNGYYVVDLMDMRYGRGISSAESMWAFRVRFDAASGRLVDTGFVRSYQAPEGRRGRIREAWSEIWTP